MPVIIDAKGEQADVKLSVDIYKEAEGANLGLPQFVNRKFDTNVAVYGTAWDQLCASSGLIRSTDKSFGLKPPTLGDVLSGKAQMGAATTAEGDPASRILYPAAVLEMIESELAANKDVDPNSFDQMVAKDISVNSSRIEQPEINVSRTAGSRYKAISQLAEPETMVSITTKDISRTLPALSLGLEVSDQALQATTLDFVSLVVGRTASVENHARTYDYLLGFLQGDADNGDAALVQTKASTFDTSISSAGVVTKTALVKWLFNNSYKRGISHIVADVAGMLAIEAALGTTNTGNYPVPGLAPQFSLMNRVLSGLQVMVVDPQMNWPANTLMGLDSRWAIARVRNAAAQYSALEQFVLRRSNALRFDFSEIAYRLFDDAFDVLSLTI